MVGVRESTAPLSTPRFAASNLRSSISLSACFTIYRSKLGVLAVTLSSLNSELNDTILRPLGEWVDGGMGRVLLVSLRSISWSRSWVRGAPGAGTPMGSAEISDTSLSGVGGKVQGNCPSGLN